MSKPNMVAVSIKNLRKEKSLTQDQLAEALHVTRQAVSNWENGKTEPDIETITQLAEFFEVDVEKIIYGKAAKKWTLHLGITNTQNTVNNSITLGNLLAIVISYAKWQSIGWAILHGIFGWAYVIYYIIKY